jgi:hypothetical protein
MATLAQRISDLAASVRNKINAMTPRLLPSGGGAGQFLRKRSGTIYDSEWADVPVPVDPWTYAKLAADVSNSNTTPIDVSALGFTPVANKTYIVEGVLMVRTSNTAAGVYLGAAYPTNCADQVCHIRVGREGEVEEIAYNIGTAETQATPLGHLNTTQSWWASVNALLVTAAATPNAAFRIRLASETAARAVTIKKGSYIRWREI